MPRLIKLATSVAAVFSVCATATAQFPVRSWSYPSHGVCTLDEAATSASPYSALAVGKVSTSLRPDVLALQGSDLALWISPGRYYYAHRFPASSGAALVPNTTTGRNSVLAAHPSGLVRYDCTQASVGTGASIQSSSAFAGATNLDVVRLGTKTYVAGRTPAESLVIAELSGNSLTSVVTFAPGAAIQDVALVDWDGDAIAETAVVASNGLFVVGGSGSVLMTLGGTGVQGQVARAARPAGDHLIFGLHDPITQWSYVVAVRGVTPWGAPIYDTPAIAPCPSFVDLCVADADGDGLDDVLVADSDVSSGARAWILHQGTDASGAPVYEFDLSPTGRFNQVPLSSGLTVTSAVRIAAGDYDGDGDNDVVGAFTFGSGSPKRTANFLSSPERSEKALQPQVTDYSCRLDDGGGVGLSCTYTIDVLLPQAPPAQAVDTLEVAVWWQHPQISGGAVESAAVAVLYRPIASNEWGTMIQFDLPEFVRPSCEDPILHQLQFTYVKTVTSGALVAAWPTVTLYHDAVKFPEAVDHGGTDPDEPPGGMTGNPTIRPPNNPPTP